MADRSLCSSPSSSRVLERTDVVSKLTAELLSSPWLLELGLMGLTSVSPPDSGRLSVKFKGAVCSGSTSQYSGGGELMRRLSKLAPLHSLSPEVM